MRTPKTKLAGTAGSDPNRPAQDKQQRRCCSTCPEDTPLTPAASEAPILSLRQDGELVGICPHCSSVAVERAGYDLLLELFVRARDQPALTPEMEGLLAVGGHAACGVLVGRSACVPSERRRYFQEVAGTAAPLDLYLAVMHAFYGSPLIRPLLEMLVSHRADLSLRTPEYGFPWGRLLNGAHLEATKSLLRAVGGGRVH